MDSTNSTNRRHLVDTFIESEASGSLSNCLLTRAAAKNDRFQGVDFKYTIFDACYLRKCSFEDCDFTGCRFVGSNFSGSVFVNCKFDYAVFQQTLITDEILENNAPSWDNLKLAFARTLRMNFHSLGDTEAVKKAIALELEATETHRLKCWNSPEGYYRSKFSGLGRAKAFLCWASFKAGDLLWGNGESVWKLLRAVFVFLVGMALLHVLIAGKLTHLPDYWQALHLMPAVLLGIITPDTYHPLYLSLLVLCRLVFFGLFMAILIKRLSRR